MGSDTSRRQASLFGMPVKHLTLAALVLQNSALVILMRYSRVMPLVNGDRYYTSTAVFLSELLKFAFFLSVALYEIATSPQTPENSTISELASSLSKAVLTGDSWKLAIPALLFTLQNSLQYVAASNMDAATFAVTFQLKVVSTALFGIFLLSRVLDVRKWASLALMVLGVAIVQTSHISSEGKIPSVQDLRDGVSFHSPRSMWEMEAEGNVAAGQLNKRSATYEGIDDDVAAANPRMNASIGLAAAVFACIISGLACVFFERTLKAKAEMRTSVWVRNVQLSFYSLCPALFLGVIFMDGEYIAKTGFLTGYNLTVWTVVILQAMGGVLTALAIKYSDSMTKTFATSVSSVITFLISAMFLEFQTTSFHLLGTIATVSAAFMFNSAPDDQKARPPPISVTHYHEKSQPGYFDIEAIATAAHSPLRDPLREALTTSRPTTPVSERRHLRSKSTELRFSKRDQ